MPVRPFDWRDLTYLNHYRHHSVFLHSALVLTRGPLVLQGALLSFLAPGMGVFTGVSQLDPKDENPAIGQIIHLLGAPFAHLTFVTPEQALESLALPVLLEYLVAIAGGRGAFRLLADVDERTGTFEVLRRSGFAIYTRQRIWQLTRQVIGGSNSGKWRIATRSDVPAIRLLYNNIVPGMVQQIEPISNQHAPRGMVYHQNNDLLAFVETRFGHRGVWLQPFFHPDTQNLIDHFLSLLQSMPRRGDRPVYICVRSYQSWLEPYIEELGAESGARQAVMVKQLTSLVKAGQFQSVPALESGHMEVTASIVPMQGQIWKN